MTTLEEAPCDFDALDAPSLMPYLRRFAGRRSWQYAYQTDALECAATLRAVAGALSATCSDVCSPERLYPIMSRARRADKSYVLAVGANLPVMHQSLEPPPGVPAPGAPRLAVLCSRASNGDAGGIDGGALPGPLLPSCIHCTRLALILGEAHVPVEVVMVDSTNGMPAWFRAAYPSATTPAMQGSPGALEGDDQWLGGFESLLDRASGQEPRVASMLVQRGPLAGSAAGALGDRLKFALIGARLAGTEERDGIEHLSLCLAKAGLDAEAAGEPAHELRRLFAKSAVDAAAELERHFSASEGAFLGGTSPDIADVYLSGPLIVAHNILEAGLTHRAGPASFGDLGAASLRRFLEAWVVRPSWLLAFRTKNLANAALVRSLAVTLAKAAPDTCPSAAMRASLTFLRKLDPEYARAAAAGAGAFDAACEEDELPPRNGSVSDSVATTSTGAGNIAALARAKSSRKKIRKKLACKTNATICI